jgi:glutaminyl-peptide cyclotransferase
MTPRVRALFLVVAAVAIWRCSAVGQPRPSSPPAIPVDTYRVVNVYPHDPGAYTQGLIWRDGFLFESTGLNGQSSVRKVTLETGAVVRQFRLEQQYFAEGLTDWKDALVQLTWQSQIGFVYDIASFALRRTFQYPGEGWGLTHDATHLIVSDGTEWLRFLDPTTFRETRRVSVRDGAAAVQNLNELEFIGGEVYANVWHTNRIARISPESGRVLGWVDLSGLLASGYRLDPEAVLNGIAYDAGRKRLFVTGKLWPKLFEIAIVRRSPAR